MTDRLDPPRPAGWQGARWSGEDSAPPPPASGAAPRRESAMERFLGGSPAIVALRLLVVSLAVGAILMWLDIRPAMIFFEIERLFHRIWMLGFDAVREVFQYIIAGAVIVLPVWFVMRLFSMRK